MMHYTWIFAIVVAVGMASAETPIRNTVTVEGDIVLTQEQYRLWKARKNQKFIAIADESKRWKDATLWYTVAMTYFNGYELDEMQWALDQFEQETCLKFRVAKKDTPNYVMVRLGNSGCSAQLGLAYPYPHAQFVDLGSGCRYYGLFLHEFGHSIGLHHEHQHPDRQININWTNVDDSMKEWFRPIDTPYETFGAPYDVQSIMHYGENAFAKSPELITMTTKDPSLQKFLIPVWLKDMSFYDAWKINAMYKCASHCNVKCPSDTFVNKHCECVTKQEFAKRRCVDAVAECPGWKYDCESNYGYMWRYCRKTCGKCYQPI